jgi:hypothetical protein
MVRSRLASVALAGCLLVATGCSSSGGFMSGGGLFGNCFGSRCNGNGNGNACCGAAPDCCDAAGVGMYGMSTGCANGNCGSPFVSHALPGTVGPLLPQDGVVLPAPLPGTMGMPQVMPQAQVPNQLPRVVTVPSATPMASPP